MKARRQEQPLDAGCRRLFCSAINLAGRERLIVGAVPPGHEKGREALRRLRARVCDACHAWPADVTLDDAARGCEAWFCRACSEHELAGIRAPRDDDGGEDEP